MNIDSGFFHRLLKGNERLGERIVGVFKHFGSDVRSEHHPADAHLHFGFEQVNTHLRVLGSMIHVREDMAVHIGVIKQGGIGSFLSKKVKHRRGSNDL